MKPKIYAYYEAIQLSNQNNEFASANIWKASWEAKGWECVMLNRSHAKNSNLSTKLVAKIMKVSGFLTPELQTQLPFIIARYSRWCALHAAGGGWMSDYDVANIDFTSQKAKELEGNTLLIVENEPCYLFYATQEHCSAAISKFISSDIFANDRLLNESEILQTPSKLNEVLSLVHHSKATDELKKHEVMESLFKS